MEKANTDLLAQLNAKKVVRPQATRSAKIIPVIVTESLIGYGIREDVARPVFQYWDFEGNLLATVDSLSLP